MALQDGGECLNIGVLRAVLHRPAPGGVTALRSGVVSPTNSTGKARLALEVGP